MTNFQLSERNVRDKQIGDKIEGMVFAEVKAVKERHPEVLEDEARWQGAEAGTSEARGSNRITDPLDRQHEVDLSPPQGNLLGEPVGDNFRDVPIITNMIGESKVPSPGDYALVAFTENFNDREPLVIGWRHNTEQYPPVARRGTYRYQRDDGEGEVMLEIYKDKERDKQDGIPEYAIFGTRDPEEQDTPPSPADNFVGLLEKGSPGFEGRPLSDPEDEGQYKFVVDGENGVRIEADFDNDPDNGGGEIRLEDPSGSFIKMGGDGTIEINASGGVTINSSTVVTEDGQVNDTAPGTGGEITDPGSGGG